jgi:hypothetical protein
MPERIGIHYYPPNRTVCTPLNRTLTKEMRTPIEPARWRRSQIAETFASVRVSASCYRPFKDVFVLAVVEAEGELIQVQRQIFAADVVIGADNTALQQGPKRLDAVGMDFTAYVNLVPVLDYLMGIKLAELAVGRVLVGRQEADVGRYRLMDEAVQSLTAGVQNHLGNDIAFAADGSDDSGLTGRFAPGFVGLLVPMAVLILPADIGFIHFDDPHKLLELRFGHPDPQPMAHIPRGLVVAASDLPLNLESADTLLTVEHLPEHLKPDEQGIFGVLEDCLDSDGEPIGGIAAELADPIEGLPIELANLLITAPWALYDAVRPAAIHQVLPARRLVGEGFHQLSERHHV